LFKQLSVPLYFVCDFMVSFKSYRSFKPSYTQKCWGESCYFLNLILIVKIQYFNLKADMSKSQVKSSQ